MLFRDHRTGPSAVHRERKLPQDAPGIVLLQNLTLFGSLFYVSVEVIISDFSQENHEVVKERGRIKM